MMAGHGHGLSGGDNKPMKEIISLEREACEPGSWDKGEEHGERIPVEGVGRKSVGDG